MEVDEFPGRVRTFHKGRMVCNPEVGYFVLALTILTVLSAIFFGFTYVVHDKR
jgi:hypothetical protein